MRVCVFGAGAVGGYVAAMLACGDTGAEVSVVARGAHLEAMRARGLVVRHRDGGPELRPRFAHTIRATDPLPPQDLVIVALKSTMLATTAHDVARMLAPDGVALYVNNGIPWWWEHGRETCTAATDHGPDAGLWTEVGVARVLGCVAILSNSLEAPGVIQASGDSEWHLGEPLGGLSSRLDAITALLRRGGLHAQPCANLRDRIWRKLLLNVPNHALASLTRLSRDAIYARPELVRIAASLVDEVWAIAQAHGSTLCAQDREAEWARLLQRAPGALSSMLQDVLAARPLEVEAIFGRVVRLGEQACVPVPLMTTFLGLLRALDHSLQLRN